VSELQASPDSRATNLIDPDGMTDQPPRSSLLQPERHQLLRRQLIERGSIRVAEEARALGVSEETIRRDIKALAAEGVAEPVFGGAVLRIGTAPALRPPLDERQRHEHAAKDAIGAAAARLVEPGQSLILDAGTTTLALAHHLRQHRALTIITNSLPAAEAAALVPASTVYVIGGKLLLESKSLVGPHAQRDLSQISADWAFLGAAAIDRDGFTSADPYEAEVKRAMIRAAKRVAVLADHTKFDTRRFASFAQPADIDLLITTRGIPNAMHRWLERASIELIVCDPDHPNLD
jgi:DeoR/GlpR family transcriptional regulator of sugar metabolism